MKKIYFFLITSLLFLPSTLHTAMTGGDFEIYSDSVGFIDSAGSDGGDFTLYGSGEPFQSTSSTNGTFTLRGGFQAQTKGILSLAVDDSSVSLGDITTSAVASSAVTLTINTDSITGYTAYIYDDGNLRSGADDINDVADGSVTAGSEEYGFITSGADGIISTDTPITAVSTAIASANGEVSNRTVGVTFRAAISGSTEATTYGHAVTFSITVNP